MGIQPDMHRLPQRLSRSPEACATRSRCSATLPAKYVIQNLDCRVALRGAADCSTSEGFDRQGLRARWALPTREPRPDATGTDLVEPLPATREREVTIALVGKYIAAATTPTSPSSRPCSTAASPIARRVRHQVDAGRRPHRTERMWTRLSRRRARHPRARRLRQPRHRGQDASPPSYAREHDDSLSGHLPGHADGGDASSPATSAAWPAPTPPSSIPIRPIPSSTSWPTRRAWTRPGGTMRLGSYPCVAEGGHAGGRGLRRAATSTSATATASR